jgi:hypothetical protein
MKKSMLAELPEGTVTGANAAAVYSKLKQMANGAVYLNEARDVAHLHDAKLDAIEELVEELQGAPLLVAYEFNHDLSRLLQRFPNTPYIGAGVSSKRLQEIVDDWNAGRITVLFAHPASAGHGLNLQGSGAGHIAWLGPIWDLELYEQFIQRVHRQGTTARRVVNHLIVAKGTIDGLVIDAVRDKSTTQERLLSSLSTVLHDAGTRTAGLDAANGEQQMKLTRQGQSNPQAAPAPAPTQGSPRQLPKGWGNPADAQAQADTAQAEIAQRQAVAEKIAPQHVEQAPAVERAKSAFSPGIQSQLTGANGHATDVQVVQPSDEGTKPSRTRARTPKEPEAVEVEASIRLQVLDIVARALTGTDAGPEDYLTVAREFTAFVQKG